MDITEEVKQLIHAEWEFDFDAVPSVNDGHDVYRFVVINKKNPSLNYCIDHRIKTSAGGLPHAKMKEAKNMLYYKVIQHHGK